MYCKPTYFFDTHNKQYLDKLVKLIYYLIYIISLADMAELVDAYGSGPYEKNFHAGSNPVIRTMLDNH